MTPPVLNPEGWPSQLAHGTWPDAELLLLSQLTPAEEETLLTATARGAVPLVLVGGEEAFSDPLRAQALAVLPEEQLHPSVLELLRQNWQLRQPLAMLTPKATEQEQTQQLIEELQLLPNPLRHLDFIANGVPGGLYQSRVEPDGRFWFNYLSPAARQIFGLEEESTSLPGDALLQLVPPEDLEQAQAAIQRSTMNLSFYRELVRIVTRQGQTRWVESIAQPYREPDGAVQAFGIVIDRTEEISLRQQQEQLGQELQVRQRLQEQLLELIPSSYSIFNLATRTVEAIPVSNLRSTFGFAEGERPDDFWASLLHPEDRPVMEQALSRVHTLADGEIVTSELRYRNARGNYFPIRSWTQVLDRDEAGQPLRIATISADLTRLRSMESQLEQARDALDLVLRSSGSSYYCCPLDLDQTETGAQAYMSPSLLQSLGLPPDAEPSQALSTLMESLHPDDQCWVPQALAALHEEGQTWNNLYRRLNADGNYRWFQDQGTVIRDQNGILYYQGISFDITDLKETQLALEAASLAKDRFLAQMSHELRTPLTAMLSLSDNLATGVYGELPSSAVRKLQALQQSGRHLLSLIEDLLDYGRIASGAIPCERTEVEVEDLCREALTLVQPLASEKGVRLRLSASYDRRTAQLDSRLMRQVLVNLLQNAIRFSRQGDRIDLDLDWCAAETESAEPSLQLSVTDQGPGIPEELQQKVFEPFFQGPPPPGETTRGTGQGLPLVQQIVALHGGSIELDSHPGQGSCFRVVIPAVPEDLTIPEAPAQPARSTALADAASSPATSDDTAPPLLLLAEDDGIVAMAIADSLQHHGYRVLVAHCGVTALTMVAEHNPDLLILDVQMPNLTGLEVIERLRAQAGCESLPILAMTAYAHPQDQAMLLEAGANAYLSKPVQFAQLVQQIDALLSEVVSGPLA